MNQSRTVEIRAKPLFLTEPIISLGEKAHNLRLLYKVRQHHLHYLQFLASGTLSITLKDFASVMTTLLVHLREDHQGNKAELVLERHKHHFAVRSLAPDYQPRRSHQCTVLQPGYIPAAAYTFT